MFHVRIWQTGFMEVVGLLSFFVALKLLGDGTVSWLWGLLIPPVYYLLAAAGSVGFHFLFCHAAWRAPRWVEIALALIGTLLCIGSPIQWAVGHTAHHDYADTENDPHNATSWWGLFLGRYNRPRYSFRFARHLIRDRFHMTLHRYAVLWIGFVILTLGLIDWRLMLFGYLAPLGLVMFFGALHNVISHDLGKGPRDLTALRWLYPFEWSHGSHHERPRDITVSPAVVAVVNILKASTK
ncbi:MAG: hypothetical protein ACK4FJ_18550 [Ferrovibrio sp.]|uniref:hypothetical protein n=1 Tax=Ferrovibrio sp. TaxID=1917215 RepID=UPI00391DCD10